MKTTILLDGDCVVYRTGHGCQEKFEWGDTESIVADKDHTLSTVDSFIYDLKKDLEADKVVVCLSDHRNFRKELNPDYKANRDPSKRPVYYQDIRDHFFANYNTVMLPRLEADDILGILATHPSAPDKRIITSLDKDLLQIPGYVYNYTKPDEGIHEVSEEESYWLFMFQTLMGDPVDNYKGCHRVGEKTALKLLNKAQEAGENLWEFVVKTYVQRGHPEEDAVLNARMARILRYGEYDMKTQEVKLWER